MGTQNIGRLHGLRVGSSTLASPFVRAPFFWFVARLASTDALSTAGPEFMKKETLNNRRIRRARGFHRAWLIAERLNRLQDTAGVVVREALLQHWLARQRRWA
jgi:hypothetical protein